MWRDPQKVAEVLQAWVSGQDVVDTQDSRVSINAVPKEHAKVQAILQQLETNQGPDKQAVLKKASAGRVRKILGDVPD